jgi:hypothetical protein
MRVFFQEKENLKSELLIETFEKVYWQCPNVISHIELNFKYLYYQNEKMIKDYYDGQKAHYLRTVELDEKAIYQNYFEFTKRKVFLTKTDPFFILEQIIKKEVVFSTGEQQKVAKHVEDLVIDPKDFEYNRLNYIENFRKLEHSLEEYAYYQEYKFILDDLLQKYNDREKFKNAFQTTFKKIVEEEKKLRKLNLKILKVKNESPVSADKTDILLREADQMVLNIRGFYKELEMDRINDKVASLLGPHSEIYDALYLAASNYWYLTNLLKTNNPEITVKEIQEKVTNLQSFVMNPYNNVITNLGFTDEKNLINVITDRYHLHGINVDRDLLSESNINSTREMITLIERYFCLELSELDIKDIEFLMNSYDIWNKESETIA